MACFSCGLLGPPGIQQAISAADAMPNFLITTPSDSGGHPSIGQTENPLLDFFLHVVPKNSAGTLMTFLGAAWDRDPLTALKLICNLRGVRDAGRGDREGFYTAALWLHRHHPKTLALNVGAIAEFGYLKDLTEILHRLVGADHPSKPKRGEMAKAKAKSKEEAAELRRKKRSAMAIRAVERYRCDPDYRFLHDRVADLFASLLRSELDKVAKGIGFWIKNFALAAKWCPSLDSCYDRSTLLCEAIARRLFPRDADPEYPSLEERHYVYRVRDRLRRAVLVPLREKLQLPEISMSSRHWDSLEYRFVPSVAMRRYWKTFCRHDMERFFLCYDRFLNYRLNNASYFSYPDRILLGFDNSDDWEEVLEDLSEKGSLRSSIAVCDVSDSMIGYSMAWCLNLGYLISELSDEPWKGRFISFSTTLELHQADEYDSEVGVLLDLHEHISISIQNMPWECELNLQKVFDLLLAVAVEKNLTPERMVKRVFVLTNMKFGKEAWLNEWESDYEVIRKKFQENGYGSVVPEVVYWKLRNLRSAPVVSMKKGLTVINGFSKSIWQIFLDEDDALTPEAVMEAVISGEKYDKLAVYD